MSIRIIQSVTDYTAEKKGDSLMTGTTLEIPANLSLNLLQRTIRIIDRWTTQQGSQDSAINGVNLIRYDQLLGFGSCVYEPALFFVIQGIQTVQLGDRTITYEPLSYLTTSVHLPVLGQVVKASPDRPFLGVKVKVDPQEIANLVLELGDAAPSADPKDSCPELECGLCMSPMDLPMQSALYRLLSLLDAPMDIPVLSPLVRREIIYRALIGEMGSRMRKFASADSQSHRISTVISTLKDHYSEPLKIRELADAANMSESTLYHSFKLVTRMSPLQFQKKLRLHEARRLMLTEGFDAATASYRVGYESPSHFSREYSRMFGAPPRADVTSLRGIGKMPELA